MDTATPPVNLVDAVGHLMIDRYANTAGAVVWFYEYLLTLSAEYEYIWKRRWSLVKSLYLLIWMESREVPYQFNCVFYDIAVTILRAIQLLVSTWLILIVVQSLSLDSRSFKYFIYLVFLATNIVAAVFAIITLKEMYPTIAFLALFNICNSNTPDSTRWLYLSQVPFDFLLLAIELYYYWRLHRLIAPVQPTKLITVMYLDGVWYFVATIIVKLTAGLVIIFGTSTYWYIATSADQAFTSTFIARLVLHLRSVAAPSSPITYTDTSNLHMFGVGGGTGIGTGTGPEITVPVTAQDQEYGLPEEHLGVRWPGNQHGHHDDESGFGEYSVGDNSWRHGEDYALEMDVHVKKKSPGPSTSGYLFAQR